MNIETLEGQYSVLRLQEQWQSIVMSTSVCLSVCLSVHEDISGTTRAIFTNFSVHVAYGRGSVLLRHSDEIPRGKGGSGVFFPIDNALYSIVFGTHTKTAEAIDMLFRMTTLVGSRYHVLDGGPDPPRGRGNFGGNVVAHCKVMGHFTVSCAKTVEPINMPFWMKTRVGQGTMY